ncbi:MAG: IclR family transcriptional regulator [Sphingomonas bacterium]|nr:IclR family transcriptional regulator [Sphingomonas bacterium]MDB5682890.1 IclR family transcriptional regulator [Sphingomonas bacterium]MDB5718977.1 IclR family transcriptional regulator [Sphingomonas bacterium]
MAEANSPQVKSALRTLDILEIVVDSPRPLAAQEISELLSIPLSSLSYLLATLLQRGYLTRQGDRRYLPGPAMDRFRSSDISGALTRQAAPFVRSLHARLNETTGFFLLRGFEIEVMLSETGLHALRYTLEIGQREPLHAFAAGKAILAALDEPTLARYFNEVERVRFTDTTVVEEASLRHELAEIRRSGIARTDAEQTPGIMAIGSAIRFHGGIGALSVAVPLSRYDEEVGANIEALLRLAAAQLSDAGG